MKNQINNSTVTSSDVLRPTNVEVNLDSLKDNFAAIKKFVGVTKVMPILKANAYGHGLVEISKFFEKYNAEYIGVAFLEEAILLRHEGIKTPILVLGGILGNQIPHFLKYDLTITASSIDKLIQINEAAEKLNTIAKVHLKIDTGLERIGVHYYNAHKFLEVAIKYKNIFIEGIYSHFANSDSDNLTYSKLQLERFYDVLYFFEKHSLPNPVRHISNSGAILQMPEANMDMVRPGILLFGVYPSAKIVKSVTVKPALTWKSRVVYFKVVKPGHPVGYGSTWETDHNIRVVTVPVGYGDGYFRSMSGKANVIIREKKYPVIGTISMDQIVVNIDNDSAYNDDEVILVGGNNKNKLTCEELASWAGTIPYEILTNINTRVPRVYYES